MTAMERPSAERGGSGALRARSVVAGDLRSATGPLCLLLSLALLLLGCGRAPEERVRRVIYWEKWTGFEGAAMDRVVEGFNARERARGVHDASYRPIEVERVTVSEIEQKLLVAIAGKNPPDVAGFYSYLLATYADKGALTDLSPRLEAANIRRSAYLERYFDMGVHRERVWALPVTPSSIALHWNRRLFAEAGLDPEVGPRTIAELDAFAERLTRWEVTLPGGEKRIESGYLPHVPAERKRLLQAGFLPTDPIWWPYVWGSFFGGSLTDEHGNASTDTPDNVRGYAWFGSYARKLGVGAVQRFRSGFGKFSTPQNPFLSGKIAMQLQGVFMFNFIQQYAPGLQWNVGPFPHPEDRPELARHTLRDLDILVIPRDSRHPDEAFEFIRYVSSPEVLERLCLEHRKFTPLKEVSDEFWREHPHPHIRLFRELAASETAFSVPKVNVWNEYLRDLSSATDSIQHLTSSPREALGAVRTRVQRSIDRERRAHELRNRR